MAGSCYLLYFSERSNLRRNIGKPNIFYTAITSLLCRLLQFLPADVLKISEMFLLNLSLVDPTEVERDKSALNDFFVHFFRSTLLCPTRIQDRLSTLFVAPGEKNTNTEGEKSRLMLKLWVLSLLLLKFPTYRF